MNNIQSTINWIQEHWTEILAFYGALVAFCTAIVKITPSTKDDELLGKVIKVVDCFSTAFTKQDAKVIEEAKESKKDE